MSQHPASVAASHRRSGPGRLIIAIYAIFVIGTVSRSAFQIATKWDEAPLAYGLSAFAAAVYVVATVSLTRPGVRAWWVSVVAISIELVGVLAIGTWSVLAPEQFPDATVWSHFGRGYLFIPLVLPVAGLWWLWRTRPGAAAWGASDGSAPSDSDDSFPNDGSASVGPVGDGLPGGGNEPASPPEDR